MKGIILAGGSGTRLYPLIMLTSKQLSKLLCDMIETDKYGIYHATNEGYISWAEFAEEIFKQSKRQVKVNYVATEEYLKMVPQQAKRPLNSRMSKVSLDKAGFKRLPDWKDALNRYLEKNKDEKE